MASQYIKLPLGTGGGGGGGGAVDSFNGRTGSVVPTAGDYSGILVTNTPAGNISATNVQAAINELDSEKQSLITGAATTITSANLTANKAVISNGSGKVAVSTTTDTELSYVSGVTSAIQTQINAKEPSFSVLPINKGGTNAITAAAARVSLNVESRSTFSNANYTVLSTDRYVAQNGTMTAPRTLTLPLASSMNAGQLLIIIDESGTLSATNSLNIVATGGNLINGQASTLLKTPYGITRLYSDGASGWHDAVLGTTRGGTGLIATPTNGQIPIGNGSGYTLSTITAGTGIGIVNAAGSVTLSVSNVNIDGGSANNVYLTSQAINGGNA